MSSRNPARGRARTESSARPSSARNARARTSNSASTSARATGTATATLERRSGEARVRTTTGVAVSTAPATRRKGASVRGRRIAESAPSSARFGARVESLWGSAKRVPFVVVILLLLAAGIGFTLFLSAKSTEDTYSLRAKEDHNSSLREQRDALLTQIEDDSSAESLAQKARDHGMVSVLEAPMIVRNDDGTTRPEGPEEAVLGAPIEPLQAKGADKAAGEQPSTGGQDGNRFGLPGAASPSDAGAQGGLSVPHQSPQIVPDLGAGRRVDGLPAPAAAEQPAAQGAAPAGAPAPAAEAAPAPAAAGPADAPQ